MDRPNGKTEVKPLAKILDRRNEIIFDVARRTSAAKLDTAPAPSPTAEYGRFLARLCMGCHGEGLGGGRIPGAPPSLPSCRTSRRTRPGFPAGPTRDFLTLLTTPGGEKWFGAQSVHAI